MDWQPEIKRVMLIGPKDKGGLELPDYEIITKSLQSAWVKRMKEGIGKQWMEIPSFYLENVGGTCWTDRLEDLLDENNSFLGYHQFCRKTGLKPLFTKFFGLISAIPSKWKQTLRSGINLNGQQTKKPDQSFFNKGTCKSIHNLLTQNKFRQLLASSRLCRLGIEYDKLKAIYLLPFNLTKEMKLSMFQYKIIHNILPYGNRLYMMKI